MVERNAFTKRKKLLKVAEPSGCMRDHDGTDIASFPDFISQPWRKSGWRPGNEASTDTVVLHGW